jgi:hypothetical protein
MNEAVSLDRSLVNLVLGSLGIREKKAPLVKVNIAATVRNIPCVVGVFHHYRDAKVAIAQLQAAGIPTGWIVALSRNYWRYDGLIGFEISDRFDEQFVNVVPSDRAFFYKRFKQGKSLVIVEGEENTIRFAGAIMSRRRGHSEVWYL